MLDAPESPLKHWRSMGKPAKCFDLQNRLERPANADLLVQALLAFGNGQGVVIWGQPDGLGEVRRWSYWRDDPSQEERDAQVRLLQAVAESPRNPLGIADSSGRARNAVIEIPPLPSVADFALLVDQGLFTWLAHMQASIDLKTILVGHRGGYSLTDFRCFKNVSSALAVAMLMIADQSKPYGKALCRCKWQQCQDFYLAQKNPRGGPANRTYCSPAHRDEHHDSKERKSASKAVARHK